MEIFLAEDMGMCKGLRLIMHRTTREISNASGDEVYLFKDLVHNREAHEHLLKLGATAQVFHLEDIPDNSRVIVGPHSVPPSVLSELSKRAKVIDTSCRDVLKVLEVARSLSKEGHTVVFIGAADHEEAEMIQSAIPDSFVVSAEADIAQLPQNQPLGLVSQSTQTSERYFDLANAIRLSGRTIRLGMTICKETLRRQESVKKLAEHVDKIIVVGGRRSNNTVALATTASRFVPTWHIETAAELQPSWFQPRDRVGVTAGASTPDPIVSDVIRCLHDISLQQTRHRTSSSANLSNKSRWYLARFRTSLVDKILAIVEWIQHVRRRNPTGVANQ